MQQQNQIKHTLSQPASVEMIRRVLQDQAHASRTSLAKAACEHFGFLDARGRAQTAGCVKALRELERSGHFVLPTPSRRGRRPGMVGSARRLDEPVPEPRDVPALAGDVRGLALIKVETPEQMRLWNELMAGEHPQGAGPLVGAQMRYLIGSQHGWLGGFGFGAAALQLGDRACRLRGTTFSTGIVEYRRRRSGALGRSCGGWKRPR